ncbi:DNA recombination protein RmuC [Psychromonas sp. 14N.309.X.WAT.B.A12]|uniref:DNA recombination protein RmuC n=1 Tax=Psychromonas sp. 14N.309.X.WAT.B.A12 TaxID=2998322 RepID=UPI0025B1CC6C|nr:DNA recombination protein RmuC [Psychromonas sp. 14N.309.X.WAT.B.A12]MDN2664790.1 DNA recombination protein RmuC [Psychromonas sp. 14N.309.X.WAT.B.A12]
MSVALLTDNIFAVLTIFIIVFIVLLLLVFNRLSNVKSQQAEQYLTLKLTEQHLAQQEQQNQILEDKVRDLSLHNESLQMQANKLTTRVRESDIRLQAGEQRLRDQQATEAKLSQQFEVLSQRIFNDKSTQFKQLNEQSIKQLLDPLSTQLEGFKKQVSDCYINESKERFNLKREIDQLANLNSLMHQETQNLTNALKGDNKQQGNWGEVVLQRILENSGLREGHEYQTQVNLKDSKGQRFLPDVIVNLPQNRNIIIDSKVSLVAYERYFNSQDVGEQKQAIDAHCLSIRQHIKGLGKKDYQDLIGANTLDYVLLFVAVEPAFIVALEHDPSLVQLALDNNILLASPSNLMIALRTIENLWRFERQEKNGQLIAQQASKLYDKLRLFSDNFLEVGSQIDKAQKTYQSALKQLSDGRGNVIQQAEQLKGLGVPIKRPIADKLTADNNQLSDPANSTNSDNNSIT